ncbi:hypothetical protein [Roseovarius pacificus]|uniref:hypothetical protein n=1 Tax=Roseovarius pacificus TaxID=337701 RepID=UPI00374A20ED
MDDIAGLADTCLHVFTRLAANPVDFFGRVRPRHPFAVMQVFKGVSGAEVPGDEKAPQGQPPVSAPDGVIKERHGRLGVALPALPFQTPDFAPCQKAVHRRHAPGIGLAGRVHGSFL